MRCISLLILCFVGGLAGARAAEGDGPLLRCHFAGTDKLATDTNSAALRHLWSIPESQSFRREVIRKLALTSTGELKKYLAHSSVEESDSVFAALFDDVSKHESHLEVRAVAGKIETFCAIALPDAGKTQWENRLGQLFVGADRGKKRSNPGEDKSRWEVAFPASPAVLRCERAGRWLVLRWSAHGLTQKFDSVSRLGKDAGASGFRGNEWFDAEIDWPRLSKWVPVDSAFLKPARLQINVSSRAGDIRGVARATYPTAFGWNSVRWSVPTNLIRDPLVGFTAARNISPFVNLPANLSQAGLNPFTNQVYAWSLSTAPFQSFILLRTPNPSNELRRLSKTLPATFNPVLAQKQAGKLEWDPKRFAILWKGLSVLTPFLRAQTDTNSGSYLSFGLFPEISSTNPAPAELVGQVVGRTNLVYYDWEITQARIGHWRVLSKMPFLAAPFNPPKGTNAENRLLLATERWLSAIAPLLGNTITEATVASNKELSATRRSPIGFTAMELVALARWVNSPWFPAIARQPSGREEKTAVSR